MGTVLIVVAVLAVVFGVLGGAHWYVWRRLVRDVTVPRSVWRRTGTAAVFLLPALTFAAFFSGRLESLPFVVKQAVSWPGFLWLAVLMYVVFALLVGEAVRPLLRRALARRDARRDAAGETAETAVPAAGDAAGDPGQLKALVPDASGAQEAAHTASADGPGGTPATPPDGRTGAADADGAANAGGGGGGDADGGPGAATDARNGLSRRLFVSRVVGAGAAVAGLGTVAAGTYGVLNGPTVKGVTVPLAKLPRRAGGYRIAVVSDIHLGPVLGRAHTERIVAAINGTQPDCIAIVGDMVDGSVAELGPAAEPLARLRSRDGAFFVTGNHEYFGDAGEWVDFVRELGVEPLENARRELAAFDLAGVNDISGEDQGQGPDYEAALGDRDTSRASVLLAHQPVMIHDAVRNGVDLQLSGHTHGGQLWPGNLVAALPNPTVAGLERYGDTQLYVTRGAGAWGPPVRVGAESDITVVTLASKQA